MSLAQAYRSQVAAKQNRQLFLFLIVAGAIHGMGAVAVTIWHPEWLSDKIGPFEAKTPIPLEFVAIEPNPAPAASPPKTDRRAQVHSTAGGSRNVDRSTQTGKAAPAIPPTAIAPLRSNPIVPVQPPTAIVTPAPSYRVTDSPPRAFPSPQPARTASPLQSPASPQPTPALAPPSPAAAALQSPAPPLHAIALGGEGVSGQLNPDRSAAGAGVDAVQDDLWGSYLTGLNQAVDQHWQRVSVAATRRTRIQFRVDRQGRVTDLRLLQSSGDTVADRAAIQAVQAAAPFAPLPQNAPEEVLVVNFTFTQWLSTVP